MYYRRWMNVELTPEDADKNREFLRENKIKFESSGCYNLVHFEVYVNEEELELCDAFLATL